MFLEDLCHHSWGRTPANTFQPLFQALLPSVGALFSGVME